MTLVLLLPGEWLSANGCFPAIINLYRNAERNQAPASFFVGEWLSLVEHLVRDQGVGGSNPLSPTNIFNQTCASSGLPFTAM